MTGISTAPVDMFISLRPRLMLGPWLDEVKAVQRSIARFGLLCPIVVTQHEGRFVVVDGRKRLAAIRRLRFSGNLPRSLINIPYTDLTQIRETGRQAHILMGNRDLYQTISNARQNGASVPQIARDMYLSHQCVTDILALDRLAPRLRQAFFDRTIDFDQARTYAALPDPDAQLALFFRVGPFARPVEILEALNATTQTSPAVALAA